MAKQEVRIDGSVRVMEHDHLAVNCQAPWPKFFLPGPDPLAHCPRCCPRGDHHLLHDDHFFGGVNVNRWGHAGVMQEDNVETAPEPPINVRMAAVTPSAEAPEYLVDVTVNWEDNASMTPRPPTNPPDNFRITDENGTTFELAKTEWDEYTVTEDFFVHDNGLEEPWPIKNPEPGRTYRGHIVRRNKTVQRPRSLHICSPPQGWGEPDDILTCQTCSKVWKYIKHYGRYPGWQIIGYRDRKIIDEERSQ